MRFSSLPRRARARTWLRTRARFRGLPRSPPGGGQAANERRKTKSRRKSRFSFSFLSFYFFCFSPLAGSRDQRAAPPRWQRGRRERSRAPTPSPSSPDPPAVGGSPPRCAPLPAPPRLRGRGARPAAGSRLPPAAPRGSAGASSPFWVPGAVPRGKPALEKESPTRKQPLPMSPSRGTPRAKARGFVPLPSRGAWPGWDNGCGENGF